MTISNSLNRSSKKITSHHTLSFHDDQFSFQLPFQKAVRFYQGCKIIVLSKPASPHTLFRSCAVTYSHEMLHGVIKINKSLCNNVTFKYIRVTPCDSV
jgi:hypothetical protein